ncbi:short-chain dehydrogenase [Aspergillus sclerotioniger CBS 115572]|uniref:Short-chain dehydrogenase n=1 Tax=Aspergillus sclerotioniger CBS 115572 TaxID=1450535 RepID=A0A317XG17_9EURO|nr:short-chain dehydrogenase [Aspergillus sclerotioniger CBS 115572]PWY96128.1 short-chain dehydrogenase [Aspergillus sclerotioniger CBS 115572]
MANRYTQVHQSPAGAGDARPTAQQIIQDERLEGQWSGKVILITGCSSGLGVRTARALYTTGATLYLTARDLNKARLALHDLIDSPRVYLLHLDLNSLASVRACAEQFKTQSTRLNILIANAGVMGCPEGRTADGFETQFGTNHLAHFHLFHLLRPALIASSTPTFHSRVIILSSGSHRFGQVNFDNLTWQGEYDTWMAYAQSKTANIWTANEIERRYGSQGLHAVSLHPGTIATDLLRHVPDEQMAVWTADKDLEKYWKTPEQGAATIVWAATAKELEGRGGVYLDNCSVAEEWVPTESGWGSGYASWAFSPEKEARLWDVSLELVGLKGE